MIFSRRRVAVTALVSALAFVPAAITAASGADKPEVESQTATAIGPDRATLQARVKPRGALTSYHFEYGLTNEYGQSTPDQSAGLGLEWASVAKQVTGLSPSAKYHFRIVATNALGTAAGGDKTFTTSAPDGTPAPPSTTADDGSSSDPASSDPVSSDPTSSDPSGSDGAVSGGQGNDDGSGNSGSGSSSDNANEPELGRTVGVEPADGVVRIRKPQDTDFGAVDPDGTVPTGTVIDVRHGKILLTTAVSPGKTQTGMFWGGMFEVRQSSYGHGYADLYLRGPKGCAAKSKLATASAKRKRGASLWGSDNHGRFRTHGRTSVATVRGTAWKTTERCHGTLTFVREGTVVVRVTHGRTVTVQAGHAFLARAPR